MGSAAAMHLASASDDVVMIGPTEAMAAESDVVPEASHYDVGRVTRIADPDPFWSGMASRSIGRYRALENITGIEFFNESGFLWADADHNRASETLAMTMRAGGSMNELSADDVKERFPYFSIESEVRVMYQEGEGGTINPRSYVSAMTTRATQLGATVIDGYATNVEAVGGGVRATMANGDEIFAEHVMLATGAYAAFDQLSPVSVPLKTNKHTLVLVEISESLATGEFSGMPSIMNQPIGDRIPTFTLPPLKYPDGKYYLKIGIEGPRPEATDMTEMNNWFRSGDDPDLDNQLIEELGFLVPSLDTSNWKWLACVTTDTPDRRPVVDLIEDGKVCLQIGGNGYSAKSGDALGELGASLLLGREWPGPIPAEELRHDRFVS
jgi:sarcosine oxidase